MKFSELTKLEEMARLLDAGKPIPAELLAECKAALDRERSILTARSIRYKNIRWLENLKDAS